MSPQGYLLFVAVLEALNLNKATFFEFLAVVGSILRVNFFARLFVSLLGASMSLVELLAQVVVCEIRLAKALLGLLANHLVEVEEDLVLLGLVKLLQH